jgi:hypothetical protein
VCVLVCVCVRHKKLLEKVLWIYLVPWAKKCTWVFSKCVCMPVSCVSCVCQLLRVLVCVRVRVLFISVCPFLIVFLIISKSNTHMCPSIRICSKQTTKQVLLSRNDNVYFPFVMRVCVCVCVIERQKTTNKINVCVCVWHHPRIIFSLVFHV